jgi:predicted alpha/beta hydrolase
MGTRSSTTSVAKLRHLPPDAVRDDARCCSTWPATALASTAWRLAAGRARQSAGFDILILSDRGVGRARAHPEPLATAGVHHHLVREEREARARRVGDARGCTVLLLGYGRAW